MNHITQHIMDRYNMDVEEAEGVQDILECSGIDLSECTMKELNDEITIAHAEYIADLMREVEVTVSKMTLTETLPPMKVTWHPAK